MPHVLLAVWKQLRFRLPNRGGRGNTGRITVYHRGSLGNKRIYRYVNFMSLNNVEGVVLSFHYDPNRTAYLAFVYYLTGHCAYIIAPQSVRVGSTFFSGTNPEKLDEVFSIGAQLPLKLIPPGFVVYNIELEPNKGAKLCRSAGTSAIVLKKTDNRVLIRLRSGWNMWISESCFANLGSVSNPSHLNYKIPKAGLVRHWGFRPVVRGIAKNPVDHPHGGRSNKGMHPTTPWGRLTKGQSTISYAKRFNKQSFRFR